MLSRVSRPPSRWGRTGTGGILTGIDSQGKRERRRRKVGKAMIVRARQPPGAETLRVELAATLLAASLVSAFGASSPLPGVHERRGERKAIGTAREPREAGDER